MQAEGLYNMPHGLRPPSMAPPSLLPNFPGIRPPSVLDNVSIFLDISILRPGYLCGLFFGVVRISLRLKVKHANTFAQF